MENYDDMDNNWGNKHFDYYAGRKLKEDENFIEEEEEAIKLQQAKLKKLKEMNLLDSDQEEEKEETIKKKNHKGISQKQAKNSENFFDLNSSDSEAENKKKKTKTKPLNKEEKEEISQILKNVKIHINEIEENSRPIIEIIESEKLDQKLSNTVGYLKLKKNLHLLYTIYNLFYIHYKNQKKISDHHPVLKKMLMTKNELDSLNKSDKNIFVEIDNLLKTLDENKNKEDLEEESSQIEEGEEMEEDSSKNEELEEMSSDDVEEQKFLNKKRTNDYIEETKNKILQLKEKKSKKLEKENQKIMKEVENKNYLGQRLANENILKARGLYRKRKRYQGNAKLHLREKFYKKEKLRKNFVKEYTGKPEVYGGEATGIRRDLIRSTKIS